MVNPMMAAMVIANNNRMIATKMMMDAQAEQEEAKRATREQESAWARTLISQGWKSAAAAREAQLETIRRTHYQFAQSDHERVRSTAPVPERPPAYLDFRRRTEQSIERWRTRKVLGPHPLALAGLAFLAFLSCGFIGATSTQNQVIRVLMLVASLSVGIWLALTVFRRTRRVWDRYVVWWRVRADEVAQRKTFAIESQEVWTFHRFDAEFDRFRSYCNDALWRSRELSRLGKSPFEDTRRHRSFVKKTSKAIDQTYETYAVLKVAASRSAPKSGSSSRWAWKPFWATVARSTGWRWPEFKVILLTWFATRTSRWHLLFRNFMDRCGQLAKHLKSVVGTRPRA